MTSMTWGRPRPAIAEFFTSQGCSSCPPAEKYAGELARRPDVLVLTFHVDYWDELGWRDRFGLPEATRRQNDYAKVLGLRSVYTPQAIIDGRQEFVGSNRAGIESELKHPRDGVPINITKHGGMLGVDVGAQENGPVSDVLLVAYLRSATSSIGRGENSGRTIQETNVVRSIRTLGQWPGTASKWQVSVDSLPSDATDVAVLVQGRPHRAIVGGAQLALR